jgi:hypothetical protein
MEANQLCGKGRELLDAPGASNLKDRISAFNVLQVPEASYDFLERAWALGQQHADPPHLAGCLCVRTTDGDPKQQASCKRPAGPCRDPHL